MSDLEDLLVGTIALDFGKVAAVEAELFDYEECLELLELVATLSKQVTAVKAAIEVAQLALVRAAPDNALVVGDFVYTVKQTGKWRPDWTAVKQRILHMSLYSPEGERLDPDEQVNNVLDIALSLFTSETSAPKVGATAELLKCELSALCDWDLTGYTTKETRLR